MNTTLIIFHVQLPDEFDDFVAEHVGRKGSKQAFFTHCQREFFHEQLRILFDVDFVTAYKHGIVIKVFQWRQPSLLPTDIHILGGLSRKVSTCSNSQYSCPLLSIRVLLASI